MGDPDLQPILQSVSWMFLWMPILATLRGYFQGNYRMEPTAISQVAEQLVRVGAILFAAYLYTKTQGDLYAMGANAMSGATVGAVLASLILLVAYYKERRNHDSSPRNDRQSKQEAPTAQWGSLVRRYATEGTTICLLSAILVLFQLIDSFTLYNGLLDGGTASELAKNVKGIYDRGQPLVAAGHGRRDRVFGQLHSDDESCACTKSPRRIYPIRRIFASDDKCLFSSRGDGVAGYFGLMSTTCSSGTGKASRFCPYIFWPFLRLRS